MGVLENPSPPIINAPLVGSSRNRMGVLAQSSTAMVSRLRSPGASTRVADLTMGGGARV